MKKHILYAIPLFASCLVGCSDWDDHFSGADNGGAVTNVTLWQMIKNEPQLSNFAQVLEETKVFRQHKKTSVSYAELLDGGQSFTVVAPVNESLNDEYRDSLLAMVQTAQGDSVVEKSFIFNHISRSLSSITPDDKRVLLLNAKYAEYANGKVEGVSMITSNKRAKNGVLHVAEKPIPYERNLYEMLCDKEELAPIGAVLRSYEEDYFDADQSVSNGMVEGVPIYVDSVIVERNKMLNSLGYLNREDSLYLVAAPTKDEWNRLWDETSQYFMYHKNLNKGDSLQKHYTMRSLMEDAVFSMSINPKYVEAKEQGNLTSIDSMMSVPYYRPGNYKKPVYHVFHKPFAEGGVLANAREVQCSNGVIYEMDEWTYDPLKTFFRELWVETENQYIITEYKSCFPNTRRLAVDSISEGSYLQILNSGNTNWQITFRLTNTLSAHYDVCAIVLPRTVTHPNETFNPCKFTASISYLDEKGVQSSFNCKNTQFKTDPEKIDTVVLAENFYFPACNYAQDNNSITLKLTCNVTPMEAKKYSREMYLDCIYLRPRIQEKSEE